MSLSKEDLEVMSHIDPKEFVLSQEEVVEAAFIIAGEIIDAANEVPSVDYTEVWMDNAMRVHYAVVSLLESHYESK